jgi:hypothetical protein
MNQSDKIYESDMFRYYILDPNRKSREKIYVILTIILGILFEIMVYSMQKNFPDSIIAGIPVFALIVWILIVADYIIFIILGGAWVLDLKNDVKKEWNK